MTRARVPALAALCALVAGCDASETFRSPTPSWSRMLEQRRVDPYAESEVWPDGRAMREPPRGTVARDAAEAPWIAGGAYVTDVPMPTTRATLERGRASFDTTCATCHGVLGDGQSVVGTKMELVKPPPLVSDRVRAFAAGRIYEIVRDGHGLMPSYAAMLSVKERWEVVLYVRALDASQRALESELPAEVRAALHAEAP